MATAPATAPSIAPDDYFARGKRLVRVLSVGDADAQVEDALTLEFETLSLKALRDDWKPVARG